MIEAPEGQYKEGRQIEEPKSDRGVWGSGYLL